MENKEINVKALNNLKETELIYLLEHKKDELSEEQISYIESKINKLEEKEINLEKGKVKTYTLNTNFKNGYVNIIVLMLATWITCLCGMFYVYSNIMG